MSHEPSGSHVVHVRENSASEMEALFKVVDPHAQEANKSIPFRDRNLPASFFQQPGLNQMGLPKGGPETQGYGEVGPISHMRAHSSPASLQQTLSAAPPPPQHQHLRQHSCELLDEPLPPGWGMARTPQGQRYFLNHVLQTTTWQDPRKSHSPNSLGSPQQPGSPASGTQTPPGPVDVSKLPVPPGWERAYTPEGEMYFINHVERTTSWFHPSLSQQQRVGMRLPHHAQQPAPVVPANHQAAAPSPHPPQQQPPQPPPQQMMSPVSGASSPPVAPGALQRGIGSAVKDRQLKLLQLQKEKEILMKRQEELNRQEMMIRKGDGAEQTAEMTTVADPFLGQTGSNTDHSRQESADSGLGGMGTSYNLPRTPDDFLSNMEEMDIHDGGPKVQGQGDFGSMDIASVGDTSDSHNMDSEDLVPSLQEDISSELLKDVENVLNSNKVENLLTWL